MGWLLRRVRLLFFFLSFSSAKQLSNCHMYLFLNINAEIMTSTVDIKDDSRGRPVQKAKVCGYDILFGNSLFTWNLDCVYYFLFRVFKIKSLYMMVQLWSFERRKLCFMFAPWNPHVYVFPFG